MRRLMTASLAVLVCLAGQVAAQAPAQQIQIQIQIKGQPAQIQPAPAIGRVAIRLSPVPERVATADCIVVGKVSALEKKTITAHTYPGNNFKAEYQIASVKISKAFTGVKGLTDIRVGFIKPMALPPPPKGGPVGGPVKLGQAQAGGGQAAGGQAGGVRPHIVRPIGRPYFYQPSLTVGQEGIFFLNKHFEEDFYILSGYQSVISKANNANFDKELAEVKRCVKLLAKPVASLKSKEASERLLTASLLISRYRTPRPGMIKTESVDAEQSKLILNILAEADWSKVDMQLGVYPLNLFYRLNLTAKDGWAQPKFTKDYMKEMTEAGKAWLQKNAATYRIQRYVAQKKDKK